MVNMREIDFEEGNRNEERMDFEFDTGLDSHSSSGGDDIVEDLEQRGVKRNRDVEHEDADDDVKDDNDDDAETKKQERRLKRRKKVMENKKLHKPPTADELNRLRETDNLFHSNLFRLQIEEMLKEVLVKRKHQMDFSKWFDEFTDWVSKVEDNENKYEITDQAWLKKFNIKIPVSQVPYAVKGTYQFKKPARVSLIGSYATNVQLGPKIMVDVLVEMPQSFFQKEDYLNCRYHRKRALYMCELVHHIQLLPNLIEDVQFISDEVDSLKPKIEIKPFGKFNKYVTVLLHFALEKGTYKLNRFSPSKNNVRRKWYFKEENSNGQENTATPFYNSTIVSDLTIQDNMTFLKETLLMHNNIRDGLMLLKIWLRQREWDGSIGGFNGYLVSMLVCYLLQIKKINLLMSSYQVFRTVCNYLVGCDWTTNGITLCKESGDENIPTMNEFHENHKVVFVDVTGYHNICYAMSPSTFKSVQHEAQLALNWLNDPSVNSFQVLFTTKVPFYQHFDDMMIFHNGESLENIADVYNTKEIQLSHCGIISPIIWESVVNLLSKGFGKRASRVAVRLPSKRSWKIEKKHRKTVTLTVGYNLNPENYFSVVDKASEAETEAFREFWGTRSELRRFQDGTITEAVIWSGRTLAEKRFICKEISTYLLKAKFGLEPNDFKYVGNQFESFYMIDVEEASAKVTEAFDQLAKQLRDLSDIPLDIVSVQTTSPSFRCTDAFPPVPQRREGGPQKKGRTRALIRADINSCPPWVNPLDISVQMAASNKWPQDLKAIGRIRAAFNIKISESLSSQHGLICDAFQDWVEVVKNGFVFRIRVVYPNEIALLKQTVDADGLTTYKDNEKSLALEKDSVHLPKLSSALYGLYRQHNSFGPACCLVKRWVSSHLIDGHHFSDEAVELLVASLYYGPQPHEPPEQPQVAFTRFLHMMATTNWNTECIILNINDELTRPEIIEIESSFITNRPTLPAVFIATPYDRKKSIWTKDSPTPLILLRLVELCANALRIIETQIYSKTLFDYKILFEPCLDTYDVIISLNDSFNPRREALFLKNVDSVTEFVQKIPINGFDPVSLYLQELRESYDELALFFHDTYGGSVITSIWKPNALEDCDFKVQNFPARKLHSKTKMLQLNKDAILEDFWRIGKGLVKRIDIRIDGSMREFLPAG